MFKDPDTERRALALIARDEPDALIARFATLTRESGSADEWAAGEYILERLRALGVEAQRFEPELYLSIPERSELDVRAGGGAFSVRSRPPAFARATGDAAVDADVRYVPSQFAAGTASLFDVPGAARAVDPASVAGAIVLTEGFSMPGTVAAFERRGAVAQIFIHPGEDIHEGICTPIWGTPTEDALAAKPRTPVVCINKPDGERLIAAAAAGPLRASIRTWLREGWSRCLLPVATIEGTDDPDEFLLIHGHYDSWYVGIGDNATGDAALLELARLLHAIRSRLKRSVRIAWWPGHSTGRYAGSAWYADRFALDIDDRCVAHLNIDSPGCAGATAYEEVMWMAEAAELCVDAIADAVGAPARGMRPLRAGDYSFNQIGPSAFYMLLSNIPQEERRARGLYAVGGCGGSTAWHTPHDELPLYDFGVLERDLRVYLTSIVRVINAPLLPFDYGATISEIAAAVDRYRDAADGRFDFTPLLDDLRRLRAAVTSWRARAAAAVAAGDPMVRRRANAMLRRIARTLVPIGYARGERFDHDPAVKLPAVPRLEAATRLAGAPADQAGFVETTLLREMNKIRAAIRALERELGSYAF